MVPQPLNICSAHFALPAYIEIAICLKQDATSERGTRFGIVTIGLMGDSANNLGTLPSVVEAFCSSRDGRHY